MNDTAPVFLGLDVGTQSVRAAFFNAHGDCVATASANLDTHHPHPGWAEQHVAQWWQSACSAVRQAMGQGTIRPEDVFAIGLDCTACTVLPCRLDGTPLRPALLWMDQRSVREAEQISATGNPILRYASGVVSPEWMLPKALWLKRNEPDIYATTERLVECTDWFMYRLTGNWTLSLNHVAVKWNYARPDGGWSAELLRRVGLGDVQAKWPPHVIPLGGGDGKLCAAAAADLGLRPGTPVAQGGVDAYLGMLGLGAVADGDLALIMGSSTCHMAMASRAVLGSGMLGCFPDAVVEGLYTLEGGQTSTGSIVNWYRQHFAGNEAAEAQRTGRSVYEVLDAKASAVPPGCEGLVCLDYWQGNRCPRKDPRASGAFWGLTLAHGPGHLFRSVYEATAFGTRHILDDLRSHGFEVRNLYAGGGGAKSRLWLQIHADVLGQPIHLTREQETCALGSAMVAAVHAGHFPDLGAARLRMVHVADVVEPRAENRAVYEEVYARYLATYDALRPLMHRRS